VNPDAFGQQGVSARDVDGHRPRGCFHPINLFDLLLAELIVDQTVARLDELG
jgi:hypothetical protein